MSKKRYMPRSDAEFDEWLVNFATKLPGIAGPLGVPAALVANNLLLEYKEGYANHKPIS